MKRSEAERLLKQFKGRLALVKEDKKRLRNLQAQALMKASKEDIINPDRMNHSLNYTMFRNACVEEQMLVQEIKVLERMLQK